MRRRDLLLAPGFAAAALPAGQRAAKSRRKPNVIVLLTDDQGYGDLSGHGNPVLRTPHLDRLRNRSVRLTNFHVAPMCTPTRGQLMTGQHALTNLAMNVSAGRALLRTDLPTMAELFADAGYATGLFGKWHLGDTYPYRPEDRGFSETVWFPSSHIGSAPDHWNNDYFNDSYRHNGREQRYDGYCTDVFFDQAITWMRSCHKAGESFFTYLATNAPHGPLFVPEQHQRAYKNQPPEVARFFGMIGNIDDNLGKLEAMLRETGLDRDTIVVFFTDNGGTVGVPVHNAGMRGSKVTLWEGGHRVPCFVRWPNGGLRHGQDISALTQVQDLLPTLLQLCGIPAASYQQFEGVSLAPLLRGESAAVADRTLFVQFSRMHAGPPQWGDAAVLWKQWRLLSGESLYDLSREPGQTQNVIKQHRDVAVRMQRDYDRWWSTVASRLRSFLPIHLGSSNAGRVLLSPADWADVSLDQQREVRAGVRRNGVWQVQVEAQGQYEITLARWPLESGLRLREAAPSHDGECGSYPAGVSLPIASAELCTGARCYTQTTKPEARAVSFRVGLQEGRTKLQATFRDDAGRELCGAYYAYAIQDRV